MSGHRIQCVVAAATLSLAVAACGGSGQSASVGHRTAGAQKASSVGLTTITVGYHPDLHSSGMIETGNQQGYWKRVGLKVDSKEFSDGPTEVQALAGGDIDFGYIGPGATWLPASGRATVVTVDSFSNGDYVIGQPSITSLAQLKGKKVGYPEGTSGEMILRLALSKAGLTMSDIQKVPLDPDAVVPAFITKKIDVAAIWVPLSQTIKDKVKGAHFLARDDDFAAQLKFPQSWIVSNSLLKSKPNVVKEFLEGFAMSNDYRMQHMSDVIAITSAATNVPKDALQAQATATTWISSADLRKNYQDGSADWFTKLEQLFRSMGKLTTVEPAAKFTAFSMFPSSAH